MEAIMAVIMADPGEPAYPLPRRRRNRATVDLIAIDLARHGPGFRFTIGYLEQMVQAATGIKRTEIDRRVRSLRDIRWVIATRRTDPTLRPDEYRLVSVGDNCWRKEYRWPQARSHCPGPIRRSVLGRDKSCQICGIEPGQPYPDMPWRRARLTVGRILPGSKGGSYTISNCQAECARCNEDARDQAVDYNDDQLPPAA
jgi:hypothetical protein